MLERRIFPENTQVQLVSHLSPKNRSLPWAHHYLPEPIPQLPRLAGRNVFLPHCRGAGFQFLSYLHNQRKQGKRNISLSEHRQIIITKYWKLWLLWQVLSEKLTAHNRRQGFSRDILKNALFKLESSKNRNFAGGTISFFHVTLTKLENWSAEI